MISNPYEEIERLKALIKEAVPYIGCYEEFAYGPLGPCETCPNRGICNIGNVNVHRMYLKLKEASEEM